MKQKQRINLECKQCNKQFEVIESRKDTAKYCSPKCSSDSRKGIPTWNSGKRYEDIYTATQINHIKSKQSHPGELNGMYGKSHTSESIKLMKDNRSGIEPWNKGKKLPGMYADRLSSGEHNAYVKKVLNEENITYEEYLSRRTDKELYNSLVRRLTEMQPLHILENYDKRGKAPSPDAYHLDHIYPISKGFENNIPPELIASINNLQFIPWSDNLQKSNKL